MNLLSHTVTKIRPWDPLSLPVACAPGAKPEGNCLSADEKILFVTNRWSNTLAAIDTDTMKVLYSAPSREDATRIYRRYNGELFVTNYGERSLSIVDPATLAETGHLSLEARAIALSFHPLKPFAYISQDDDRIAVLDIEHARIDRYIQTQREPDVSRVILA
jgi:DNA-binding beta-propeller fold protein YncE